MREFRSVSASQLYNYRECERLWWFVSVLGLETPQRASAALGTEVHAHLERYLDAGTPPPDTASGKIARAGLSLLPEPGTVFTEVKIKDDEHNWPRPEIAGIPVNGFVDVLGLSGTVPLVLDHKTTSNLKYAKREAELLKDPQILIYGKFALDAATHTGSTADRVEAGHVVYLTKGAPLAVKTMVTVTREHIAAEWPALEADVRGMKETAKIATPDAVPGNREACNNYGGCHFRDRCRALGMITAPDAPRFITGERLPPGDVSDTLPAPLTPSNTSKELIMSIDPLAALAAMKARRAGTPIETAPAPVVEAAPIEAAPAPVVAPSAPTVVAADPRAGILAKYGIKPPVAVTGDAPSVLPPDAPPQGLPAAFGGPKPAEPTPEAAPAEKAARKPRAAKVAEPEAAPVVEASPAALEAAPVAAVVEAAPAAPAPGLVIYIDCEPVKGRERSYTLLEDLVAPLLPVALEMHNKGAKDGDKSEFYSLIPYNRGPGYVAALVLRSPPTGVLICNTRMPATGAVLEVLIPMADAVVRALR